MTSPVRLAPRIPPLPSIRDILKLYGLRAMRQLSQNFLMDQKLNNKIVKCCGKIKGHEVCEVGPGPGNITRSILSKGAEKVFLIEKDERFLPCLQMLEEAVPGTVKIIKGDVLNFDMENLFSEDKKRAWEDHPPPIHVVGNLPFNVSTPLIVKWLKAISERKSAWRYGRVQMTLTFQKEVAERMEAIIMSSQRCRLSIMCQNWCEVQYRFVIPGAAFVPKPKVDVGVVHLKPRIDPIIPLPFDLVEKVVSAVFKFRQKQIHRGIQTLFPLLKQEAAALEMLKKADINPTNRSFQLSVSEIGRLCFAYREMIEETPSLRTYKRSYADKDWMAQERMSEQEAEEFERKVLADEFY